jgi:Predicted ATPase
MTLEQQALAYAANGWCVFPVYTIDAKTHRCTCGHADCTKDAGKHPMTANGVSDASNDPAQIKAWFGGNAACNIGIATGQRSGLTVVDIDIGEGKQGAETWAALIAEHGEPQTLCARTGGGGLHFYFQYTSALKSKNNGLGPHVDVKNDGGYVVAPPSNHQSGSSYTWINWGASVIALPGYLLPVVEKKAETRGRPKKDDVRRQTFALSEAIAMLKLIPADDRDLWRNVGVILGRTYARSDKAWAAYNEWADTWGGQRDAKHDRLMHECFYDLSTQAPADGGVTMGTIVKLALEAGWVPVGGSVPIEEFVYYGKGNNFLYRSTSEEWLAAGVDAVCSKQNIEGKLIKASDWLKTHQAITSITCDPLIDGDMQPGVNCRSGMLIPAVGACVFNLYRRPTIELGDPKQAKPWVQHVKKVFNKDGDAEQFMNYMAHRVQRPGVKPRFALLIAGGQGVGKDTAVDMCVPAIGAWNVKSVEPSVLDSAYTAYKVCTLLRIHEASNLPDMSKWAFNEQMKTLIAGGGQDGCEINPKYGHQYTMRLYCGVILTTNHLLNGIFIPEDDRRYDVIDSASFQEMGLQKEAVRKAYFDDLYDWFFKEGGPHIAAFLMARDLAKWSPDHGQRKTLAHKMVIQEGRAGDLWLMDILDELKNPDVVRVDWIMARATQHGLKSDEINKKISHAMTRAGYGKYTDQTASASNGGRWRINGKLQTVFVRTQTELSIREILEKMKVEIF